jgi:hypothetical protein
VAEIKFEDENKLILLSLSLFLISMVGISGAGSA